MGILKLNETPVRTSRNFNINNIKLENITIPEIVDSFNNLEIINESSKINIEESNNDFELTYSAGEILVNNIKQKGNKNLKLIIDSKKNEEIQLSFKFNKDNLNLLDNIQIIANEGTKATVIIKYESSKTEEAFHNGIIKTLAKENSKINISLVNLMNESSNNFISIQNDIEKLAEVNYTIVDFGGKVSITNYYSNITGEKANNTLNTIYLGKDKQILDLNYIAELRGEKSNIDIDVIGALKENAKKHFKGTIDFKKGAKKAKGNENEYCMLLSDNAKSIALPMLLCSEEDVEGNHSSSAGKIGEKELFYIMSRGFELKEALKLMVRAKFNKVLDGIQNENLKEQIIEEIDKRLD